jgi:hypothetical protein
MCFGSRIFMYIHMRKPMIFVRSAKNERQTASWSFWIFNFEICTTRKENKIKKWQTSLLTPSLDRQPFIAGVYISTARTKDSEGLERTWEINTYEDFMSLASVHHPTSPIMTKTNHKSPGNRLVSPPQTRNSDHKPLGWVFWLVLQCNT